MKTMTKMPARKERGFTLIEIAIVLVIIGLLLGGVLQGQQLIENSRVKSATNDINGIAAATFSYQDRYGRMPGDDNGGTAGATTALVARGGSWTNIDSSAYGNSNGILDAAAATVFAGTGEGGAFFTHLRAAGFITGDPTITPLGAAVLPANPFGGLMGVTGGLIDTNMAGTKICMSNVTGSAGIALDTQLDDGQPDTGRFRAFTDLAASAGITPPTAAAATAYDENLVFTICYRM